MIEITSYDKEVIDKVEKSVCSFFSVSEMDIISKRNSTSASLARGVTFYLLHYDYSFSINKLAKVYIRSARGIKALIAKTKMNIRHFKHIKEMYEGVKMAIK